MKQLLSLSINGTPVLAPSDIPTGGIANGTFPHIVQAVIGIMFAAAIVLTLFFLISAGYKWMTSGGDAKAVEAARSRIIYSIMGLVIVFVSFIIIQVVSIMFHVPLLPGQDYSQPPAPTDPCTSSTHAGPC